jgi:hypothetical protein
MEFKAVIGHPYRACVKVLVPNYFASLSNVASVKFTRNIKELPKFLLDWQTKRCTRWEKSHFPWIALDKSQVNRNARSNRLPSSVTAPSVFKTINRKQRWPDPMGLGAVIHKCLASPSVCPTHFRMVDSLRHSQYAIGYDEMFNHEVSLTTKPYSGPTVSLSGRLPHPSPPPQFPCRRRNSNTRSLGRSSAR